MYYNSSRGDGIILVTCLLIEPTIRLFLVQFIIITQLRYHRIKFNSIQLLLLLLSLLFVNRLVCYTVYSRMVTRVRKPFDNYCYYNSPSPCLLPNNILTCGEQV